VPPRGGEDATVWAWEFAAEGSSKRRTVLVKISGTAMASDDLHFRVAHGRDSKGQTEVQRVLEWEEPPKEIVFHSESEAPEIRGGERGPAVKEIGALAEWFDDRGILLVFTGRGTGVGPTPPPISRWTANLIDPKADKLLARFEASSRVAAARDAQRWCREYKEPKTQTIEPPSILSAEAFGNPTVEGEEVEAPKLPAEQLERVKRYGFHLIYTAPAEGDPDSDWMIEAYDDGGELRGIAAQKTVDDALLTILEDLLPPEER
jgi:hypothetical protein